MMLRIFIQVLFIIFLVKQVNAQDNTVQPENRQILILNKTHKIIEELNIGDGTSLKLLDATKVKGHITSIDSTSFTVNTTVVQLNEIERISKKKVWQKYVGLPLISIGALFTAAGFSWDPSDPLVGEVLFGVGLMGVGVALMLPGYQKIGKRFIVISNS